MIKNFLQKNYHTDKLPKSVKYIIFADIGERFSFYGMLSIVSIYMMTYLGFSEVKTVSTVSLFRSLFQFSQILTIFIASRLFNYYQIMLYSLISVAFGHIILGETLMSQTSLFIGMFLIFFMAGILKPVNMPFLVDQCEGNKKLQSGVVAMNYWAFNLFVIISLLTTPYIYTRYGPKYGFMFPAIAAIFSAFMIFKGKKTYFIAKQEETNQFVIFKTLKLFFTAKINKQDWYSIIAEKYGKNEAEDIKKIGIVSLVWFGSVFFFTGYENLYHSMIVHSEKLQPYLFGYKIINSQLQSVNALMPIIGLPIIRGFILPFFFKNDENNSNIMDKMAFGSLFMIVGFIFAIGIEIAFEKQIPVNVTWDLIPWVLISTAEVITYVYLLEFFSSYVSENKRVFTTVIFAISQLVAGVAISAMANFCGKIDAIYFGYCLASSVAAYLLFKILHKKCKI